MAAVEDGRRPGVDADDLAADLRAHLEEDPLAQEDLWAHAPTMVAAMPALDDATRVDVYVVLAALTGEGATPEGVAFDDLAPGLDAGSDRARRAAHELLHDYLWLDPALAREHLPDLVEGLDDDDEAVRGYALRGLARAYGFGDDEMVDGDLTGDVEPYVPAMLATLDEVPPDQAAAGASVLADRLVEDHPGVAERVVPLLVEALEEPTLLPRLNGFVALARIAELETALVEGRLEAIGETPGIESVVGQLGAQDDGVRAACSALLHDVATVSPESFDGLTADLAAAADDDLESVRADVGATLKQVDDDLPDGVGYEARFQHWLGALQAGDETPWNAGDLVEDVEDHVEHVRQYTLQMGAALETAGPDDRRVLAGLFDAVTAQHNAEALTAVEKMVDLLGDDDPAVRRAAARTLMHASFANRRAVEDHTDAVADALEDPEGDVRDAAFRVLFQLSFEVPGAVAEYTPRVAAALDGLSEYEHAAAVAHYGEAFARDHHDAVGGQLDRLVDELGDENEVTRFNAFYGLGAYASERPPAVREYADAVADSGAIQEMAGKLDDQDPGGRATLTRAMAAVAAERPDALAGVVDGLAPYRDAEDDAVAGQVSTVLDRVGEAHPEAVEDLR